MSTLMTVSLHGVRAVGVATCLAFGGLSASATTLDLHRAGSAPASATAAAVDPSVQRTVSMSLADASSGPAAGTFDRSRTDVSILLASHDRSAAAVRDDLDLIDRRDGVRAMQALDRQRTANQLYSEFGRPLGPTDEARPQAWLATSVLTRSRL